MITLITGVPGSGKTALVVEMLLEELKRERKVYVLGIPDLVACHQVPDPDAPGGLRTFACEPAGNPLTWHKGTWLKIDTYRRPEVDPDDDDFDPNDLESCWVPNGNGGEDKGALIIIDEAQTYFRPRSSNSKVPDHIAAFEVHRHQGLDFWLLTQRPNLLDCNLRGLVSRHIHIHTTGLGRKKLEWAEVQDPNSRTARALAHRTPYKPNPKVFELYRSAEVHTKLKVRPPNTVYYLGIAFVILCVSVYGAYAKISSQVQNPSIAQTLDVPRAEAADVPEAQAAPSPAPLPSALPEPTEQQEATRPAARLAQAEESTPSISGCAATYKSCTCFDDRGQRLDLDFAECMRLLAVDHLPPFAGGRHD